MLWKSKSSFKKLCVKFGPVFVDSVKVDSVLMLLKVGPLLLADYKSRLGVNRHFRKVGSESLFEIVCLSK